MDRFRAAVLMVALAVTGLWTGCTQQPGTTPARTPNQAVGGWFRPPQPPPEPEPLPPDPRVVWPPKAVWVVRRAYRSPEQIATLMEDCRRAGFNTVLFQVRGNGTAFYRSKLEPLAEEFRAGDPGFDPLEIACREAHRRGMALHAWVNVMPAWRGPSPPRDPEQLYHRHPEWFWYDQHGDREPLHKWYVSLNPCLPEVRNYLVSVFEDLVSRYRVDGLHLDYIRFPSEEAPKGSDYPHDARTLWIFKQATGNTPQQDKAAWSRWRTEQVTQLVRDIRAMTRRVRPGLKLTAACWADIEGVRKNYFQDGPAWIRNHLVDLVLVMNYSANTNVFRQRQEAWQRAAAGRPVAAGVGVYLHDSNAVTAEQVRLARTWGGGLAVFSDQALFTNARGQQRVDVIRPILTGPQPRLAR
ncbi:MAG: hypothetical protein AMXMBFR13_21430 [Phycisphaerae bacterium]